MTCDPSYPSCCYLSGFASILPPCLQMWDADNDNLEVQAKASNFSEPPGFSLDDAFSEDDSVLDAADEFSPAAIRAALARTLATRGIESTGDQTDDDDGVRSPNAGVSNRHPNRDLNGSVRVEDPDASVSTLDINASPARIPGQTPEEWPRSTSYSYGYGYRQDSQDSTSGVESLENFSSISLSDSAHDLESVEISLEPSEEHMMQEKHGEGGPEEGDQGLFRAVHIDLSQGGKPRVEEVVAVLPEPSNLHAPDPDGARTPSPKPSLPPSLPSTSTPTSKIFPNHQSQSQSVPELPSPTTYDPSVEGTHTYDEASHIPPDSSKTVLSASSLVSASSITTSESIPTPNPTASLSNSSQSEPFRRGHRQSRSVGPSALDKVISKTRPSFLPPKPKAEDLKHIADWEAMMKQSRAFGKFHSGSPMWFLCHFCALGGFKRIDLQLFSV